MVWTSTSVVDQLPGITGDQCLTHTSNNSNDSITIIKYYIMHFKFGEFLAL